MSTTRRDLIVRARPHLGTIIRVEAEGVTDALVTSAFDEVARLEKIFNFHDPTSILSQFNDASESNRRRIREMHPELNDLLRTCEVLGELSRGYFHPMRAGRFDLSGIAKGYIVDKTVEWILSLVDNSVCGSVNAGGDLRFFGSNTYHSSREKLPERAVVLRLGTSDRAVARELKLSRSCVATSAPFTYNDRVYFERSPRAQSAVVQADCAAIADALTKVALFAPQERLETCCKKVSAIAMLFDEHGELVA